MRQFRRKIVPPAENRAVHPLIRWIWNRMNADMWVEEDLADRAGVTSSCIRKWRRGERNPRLQELEAVINALGYRLVVKEAE